MAPTDDAAVEAMRVFGYETGMAFQIVDDILDFNGEQTAVGKPLGSDLLQGLVTLPAIYYAEANPDDPNVKTLSEGGWGNQERMEELVKSIRQSEAIKLSLREAEAHIVRALGSLTPFKSSSERSALEELATYIIARNI